MPRRSILSGDRAINSQAKTIFGLLHTACRPSVLRPGRAFLAPISPARRAALRSPTMREGRSNPLFTPTASQPATRPTWPISQRSERRLVSTEQAPRRQTWTRGRLRLRTWVLSLAPSDVRVAQRTTAIAPRRAARRSGLPNGCATYRLSEWSADSEIGFAVGSGRLLVCVSGIGRR